MSSILRALKKLEQDTAAGRTDSAGIPGRTASSRRSMTIPAGFAIIVLLFALGFLFFLWPGMRQAATPAANQGKKLFTRAGAPLPPDRKVRSKPVDKTEDKKPALPRSLQPVKPHPKEMHHDTAQTAQKDFYMAEKTDLPVSETAAKQPGRIPVAEISNKNTQAKASAHRQTGEKNGRRYLPEARPLRSETLAGDNTKTRGLDLKELGDDAGLKLQAISWSPEPARRIAVINGRIRHEGEKIEGYLIIAITPDDIRLKKGNFLGRLSFTLRPGQ